jgi:DNA polymerase-3 subunit delta
MTPAQLVALVKKNTPPPATLVLGPEAFQRRRMKESVLAAFPEGAVTQHDLAETGLAEVLDDARALSLFASERLIWVLSAESALPRGRGASEDDVDSDSGSPSTTGATPLADYLRNPTPGVTLVFEAIRFDFEGDDKRKQDRVRKFYSAVPAVVEMHRYSPADAHSEAESLVREAGFRIDPAALDLLIEALGADMARIAVEIEKLALFAGERAISPDDIAALVPDARAATIFALVNALGRRDRARSLATLDTLAREGEYLPLALAFLSTQFRTALAAREAGLKSAGQVQQHFTRLGMPMWGSRADQVWQTVSKFSRPQLERALGLIYWADKSLRDARPDDRTVMEHFILELVG